ncbi:GL13322 [Drosophila persimilis]|uniref:GL13322 n=1 Tax=Drosophila persimilis TaxID=7234 RepID=B4H384_DROPE|nr:GL13322 [Drosophila persimilis]
MLALVVFLVALTTVLVWDFFWRKRRNDILHYMPGPRGLPLVGNALMYRGLDAEQIMGFVSKNRNKYGPLYKVWVLNQLAVFSTDPHDIEFILSSQQHITKNNLYELLHCWLGTGLLMSTGKKWHSRRKIITPTFHFKILEQFVEIFDQQSAVMVGQLQQRADGKTAINIFSVVCLLALDIIAETAMGTKIQAQMSPNLPYVQAVTDVTNIMTTRFIHAWQRIDWLFRLVHPGMAKRQDSAIKVMHDFTENIIKQRRQALVSAGKQEEEEEVKEDDDLGQKRRMALLDVLLQSTIDGASLSNDDIREEVDTFMFEGHDTTTSAISFCLYEISRHPQVQQLLVEEIHEVLGVDRQRPVTLRDLGELKYLENVIKESLRLHPPVPMIGRWFNEDVEIRGKRIPAGTNYTVGIFVLLRDPEYFESPDEFKPDRFDSTSPQTHPYAYIPFSAGPRNCIGQKFALLEMKSTISKLLRNFELLPLGPEPRPAMNIVLRSANGVHLGLQPRSVLAS